MSGVDPNVAVPPTEAELKAFGARPRDKNYAELVAAEHLIDELRETNAWLVLALQLIAACDYRGNRSPESEIAHLALVVGGEK